MRQLKPCGTQAAYIRHLKHGEKPCDPCIEANRVSKAAYAATYERKPRSEVKGKSARQMQHTTCHTTAADKALAERPPVIVWRKNPRGIFVAVSVQDPHAETGAKNRADQWEAEIQRQEAEGARRKQLRREAERLKCTDEKLLSAARTEI